MSCAGGVFLSKMPTQREENTFVISCEKDKNVVNKAIKNEINIMDKEIILTGLLKQKIELDKHRLLI